MNWDHILKRVIVGVVIAIIMMFVHKAAHAATEYFNPVAGTWGSSWQSGATAYCAQYDPSWTYQYVDETATQVNFRCLENGAFATGVVAISKRTVADPAPSCTAGAKKTWMIQQADANGNSVTVDGFNDGTCLYDKTKPYDLGKCYTYPKSATPKAEYCEITETQTGEAAPAGSTVAPVDDGSEKAPASAQVPANDSGSCPSGSSNVGSDSAGTSICVGSGTNPVVPPDTVSTTPKTTTTNSDGSSNTTESKTTGNADGSSTTATTNCAVAASGASSCSTSYTTTTTSTGAQGKKDSDTPTVCDENPQLNMCQNSQVSDSGCSGSVSSISVSGDAIQGAILRKIADARCADLVASLSKDLGNSLIAGNDPMQSQIDAAKTGSSVDIGSQGLDQSGFLGGGTCLSDRSISILGKQVPISFSSICGQIQPLRAVILAAALIVAYLIVSRSVLEG